MSLSTSADTIRCIAGPSSPALSASGSSTSSSLSSSLPSVSSSLFFSSAAASPPHAAHVGHEMDDELIIPSLTLPALLPLGGGGDSAGGGCRRPTAAVQRGTAPEPSEGLTRLLVLGPRDAAVTAVLGCAASDYDATAWDADDDGCEVLRIDSGALELICVRDELLTNRILRPFRRVADLLAPPLLSTDADLLEALLSSSASPLYTALLVGKEIALPEEVSALIPVVVLPGEEPEDQEMTETVDDPASAAALPAPTTPEADSSDSEPTPSDAPHRPPPALPIPLPALRHSAARLFLRWWRAGARGAYAPHDVPSPPTPPYLYPYLYPHPLEPDTGPQDKRARLYPTHAIHSDPLHLPSLLRLLRAAAPPGVGVVLGVGVAMGLGVVLGLARGWCA